MDPIKENDLTLSTPVSPANPQLKELDALSFTDEVNNLLKMAKRDFWTEEHLIGQVLSLTDQNPNLVKTMDFPRTAEDIKNQLVIPAKTKQNIEHLEFTVSENKVVYYNDKGEAVESWIAATGNLSGKVTNGNKGPLPPGEYSFRGKPRPKNEENVPKNYKSFTDQEGNGWSQWLNPAFETERGGDVPLSLHPDGGNDGTAGCVGLETPNTQPFREMLAERLEENPDLVLIVKP